MADHIDEENINSSMETTNDSDERINIIKSTLDSEKIKNCSLEELEAKIFLPVLPMCKDLFIKIMEDVEKLLRDSTNRSQACESTTQSLKRCLDLLQVCNNMLAAVNQLETKKIDYFISLPSNVAALVLKTFQHCRVSESIYMDLISGMGELLTSLFRKAQEIQMNLMAFLNSRITFNCAFQIDLDLLVEVMDILHNIGEVLIDLDIKTLALHWKGYMQLTEVYSENLKMWVDIKRPVTFLANTIVSKLEKIFILVNTNSSSPADDLTKQVMKDLKISNFLLKVVVKLCELYKDNLGDCYKGLLALLISLNGFSSSYLCNYKLPDGISDYIERHVTIAAGPLLTELFQDKSFILAFHTWTDNCYSKEISIEFQQTLINSGNRIGFMLLMIAIMKKLNTSEPTIQKLWTQNDECSLVRIVFSSVENSGTEMNLDTIVNRSESLGASDIYEALLTHTAAHVINTVSEESFGEIEKLLVSKILQPHIFIALFASDVFCLLSRNIPCFCMNYSFQSIITRTSSSSTHVYGIRRRSASEYTLKAIVHAKIWNISAIRFGNNELRLAQVQYFIELISKWPRNDRFRPEWVFLTRLTDRLMKMLPPQQVQSIVTNWPVLFTPEVDITGISFNHFNVNSVQKSINGFLCLKENNSVPLYCAMVDKLSKIPYLDIPCDSDQLNNLNTCLLQLLQCCGKAISANKECEWLEQLTSLLITATAALVVHLETDILCKVLRLLLLILEHCSVYVKLSMLEFLKRLSSKEIKATGKHLDAFKSIAHLFGKLINDENIFVNLTALETFKHFAEITKHIQIISFTAHIDRNIEESFKNFLQGTFMPDDDVNTLEFETYLKTLESINFEHKCIKKIKNSSTRVEDCLSNSMDVDSLLLSTVEAELGDSKKVNVIENQTKNQQSLDSRIQLVLNELNTTVNSLVKSKINEPSSFNSLPRLLSELENCLEKCKLLKD